MGYNFFNWTTRNMNQKFSYFPRPSIRATPIHSRHLYFSPVSTFGLPEHEFSYSLKVQCILNLATYFIFPLHRPFFYFFMSGFHGAFATGVACQQGTLTLPDTWFRPPFWDLLVLQSLRPNSSNLPCLYSTFQIEYPLVLSTCKFILFIFMKIGSTN